MLYIGDEIIKKLVTFEIIFFFFFILKVTSLAFYHIFLKLCTFVNNCQNVIILIVGDSLKNKNLYAKNTKYEDTIKA